MAKKAANKEAQAAAKAARKAASKERRQQIWQAFQIQRKEDKALLPLMAAVLVGVALVFFLLGLIWGIEWFLLPIGILLGALGAFALFGRRVSKSVYKKADGQPGAAAWALDSMQGAWRVKTAVAATASLDTVHRVVGRPGIILVGEGNPNRVRGLIAQEKKRMARIVGDTPIYDFVVGTGEGETPLKDLTKAMNKLPRNIDTKRMDSLENRLAALSARGQGGAAMPKGPMPAGAKMRGVQRTIRRR